MNRIVSDFLKSSSLLILITLHSSSASAVCSDADGDGFGVELERPCKTATADSSDTFTFSEMPVITALNESSVKVSYSMTHTSKSQIHYGPNKFATKSTPYSSASKVSTFTFTLSGLEPNTKYYYRVSALKTRASRDRRFKSDTYSFITSGKTTSSEVSDPSATATTTTIPTTTTSSTTTTTTTTTTTKVVQMDDSQANAKTTIDPVTNTTQPPTILPNTEEPAGPCVDSDGDGWGWDGKKSCVMPPPPVGAARDGTKSEGTPENNQGESMAVNPFYRGSCFDVDGDGYGYDNIKKSSCRLNSENQAAYDKTFNPRINKVYGQTNLNTGTCIDKEGDGWGSNTYKATLPGVRSSCRMERNWRDSKLNYRNCYHEDELYSGNITLQNNQWNSGAMHSDDYWLCIELTGDQERPEFRWQYDFLEFEEGNANAVKAYPQVYYGTKEGATPSGTASQLGLPVALKDAKNFIVDYKFSEKGFGERNVALESFFHTGGCNVKDHANFDTQNRSYKHIEMMVWVGRPITQAPGRRRIGEFTIDGRKWHLWLNDRLGWSYLAFATEETIPEATLNWNEFIEFTRTWLDNNHNKYPNLVPMEDDMCFRAIEMGTEIFHGRGEFTLHKFEVRKE